MRLVSFLLAVLMMALPSYGLCESGGAGSPDGHALWFSLPQFEEMAEVTVPFQGMGLEDMADAFQGGMIPYRGSDDVTVGDETVARIGRIEEETDKYGTKKILYLGPELLIWRNNDFPLQMARGIRIGMTVAEVEERLFRNEAEDAVPPPGGKVGLQYTLGGGVITRMHLTSGNGTITIETFFQFADGRLSEMRLYVLKAADDMPEDTPEDAPEKQQPARR